MNRKVDTAYFLNDPRKFDSVEQAEKELNRLRAVCIRLKRKQDEDITFLLGLSVTSSQWYGRMGYDKPKSEGGRKRFICSEKRRGKQLRRAHYREHEEKPSRLQIFQTALENSGTDSADNRIYREAEYNFASCITGKIVRFSFREHFLKPLCCGAFTEVCKRR